VFEKLILVGSACLGDVAGGVLRVVDVASVVYPSDLTDEEWALVEPLLTPPAQDGRPEKHPRREVVDAILYLVRTECAWRQLPADFPPWQTVDWYFARWEEQRVTLRMLDALRRQLRLADGRDAEPSPPQYTR
jgi:transposase